MGSTPIPGFTPMMPLFALSELGAPMYRHQSITTTTTTTNRHILSSNAAKVSSIFNRSKEIPTGLVTIGRKRSKLNERLVDRQ
jgi:hypothetical protein